MIVTSAQGPRALATLSGVLAFGATGAALALTGAGLPFLLAALAASAALALVMHAALRRQTVPDHPGEASALAQLEAYRTYTAALRHDIRGVLSPALMMSDRLLSHEDKSVQRAGQAVVRSVERATALLATHKESLSADPAPAQATPAAPAPPPR